MSRLAQTAVASIVLALGACGSDPAEQPAEPAPVTSGPGRQLDQGEASAMMPIASQMPKDVIEEDSEPVEGVTSDPARCADLRFDGEAMQSIEAKEVAKARARYTGTAGGAPSVTLSSYSVEVPDQAFDDAGAALGECATFSMFSPEDGTESYESSGLGIPELGERSFAARFTIPDGKNKGMTVDYLAVKEGHNLIIVVYAVGRESKRHEGLPLKMATIVHDNLTDGQE